MGVFLDQALLPSGPAKTKDFRYEIFKVTTGVEVSIVLAQLAICGRPRELLRDNALAFHLEVTSLNQAEINSVQGLLSSGDGLGADMK